MSRIGTYPVISEVTKDDLLIGTDTSPKNITYNFKATDIGLLPYQEHVQTFTRAYLNSLAPLPAVEILAGVPNEMLIIEETYFTLDIDAAGAYAPSGTGSINVIQGTATTGNLAVSVLPYQAIDQILNTETDAATYFRDVPVSGNRVYSINKPTRLVVSTTLSLPPRLSSITIRLKYRVLKDYT